MLENTRFQGGLHPVSLFMLMHMIVGFAVLVVITEVIGLIVWVRVENPQARGSGELLSIASSRKSAEHW